MTKTFWTFVVLGVAIGVLACGEKKSSDTKSDTKDGDLISIKAGGAEVQVSSEGKVKVAGEGASVEVDASGDSASIKVDAGEVDLGADSQDSLARVEEDGDRIEIVGNGQVASFDCKGRDVEIRGSHNRITLQGECTGLDVTGMENTIDVDAVPTIEVDGVKNRVSWRRALGATRPEIQRRGVDNTIVQMKD